MNRKALVLFTLSLALGAAASLNGCLVLSPRDYYSEVAQYCMQRDPHLGDTVVRNQPYPSQLDPTCRQHLEAQLGEKYDSASFDTAPSGFKDRVTEAFQAIIAYPLAVTNESKLFGTSPALAGAIPLEFYDIYSDASLGQNPNQRLYNYILNHVDKIRYDGQDPGLSLAAQYMPPPFAKTRELRIFDAFFNATNEFEMFVNPFRRAAILAHEARHGDSITHVTCDPSSTHGSTGIECDDELNGAYGFEVTYLKFLLHGSATCGDPGCKPPIAYSTVIQAGRMMCELLVQQLNHRYAELDSLLSTVDCGGVTYEWTMKQEGLTPMPLASLVDEPRTLPAGPSQPPTCSSPQK